MEAGEFSFPKHKQGLPGVRWRVRQGNEYYEISEEEAEQLEYARLWPMETLEKRIKSRLEEGSASR